MKAWVVKNGHKYYRIAGYKAYGTLIGATFFPTKTEAKKYSFSYNNRSRVIPVEIKEIK